MTTIDDADHTPFHRDPETLASGLEQVRLSPRDVGSVALLVRRPAAGLREVVDEADLDLDLGVVGDDWSRRGSRRGPDGGPDPEAQVTVMNSRAVELVAGPRERWALAGDQVFVDLDLSTENLPTRARLRLGGAELEVTAAPHTGCAQFSARFGVDALRLTATPDGRFLRLRGINTRVVTPGHVRVGDPVTVTRP